MTVYYCYPEGKFKALTLSYDDGKVEDRRLVEIMNTYGVRGTFNLNSGNLGKPSFVGREEVKELYANHEVACHTYSHPTLERCPTYEIIEEIIRDRKELEHIVGYPVRGLAYPNGSYNDTVVNLASELGIEYGRIVGNTDNFNLPKDYMRWESTCHHNHKLLEHGKRLVTLQKSQYLFLMYVWGHSYEFSMDQNWGMMEEFCQLVGRRDDIWYATNIEIVDYMNVLKQLRFTASGDWVMNPSAYPAWLSVEGKIIEIPGGSYQIL